MLAPSRSCCLGDLLRGQRRGAFVEQAHGQVLRARARSARRRRRRRRTTAPAGSPARRCAARNATWMPFDRRTWLDRREVERGERRRAAGSARFRFGAGACRRLACRLGRDLGLVIGRRARRARGGWSAPAGSATGCIAARTVGRRDRGIGRRASSCRIRCRRHRSGPRPASTALPPKPPTCSSPRIRPTTSRVAARCTSSSVGPLAMKSAIISSSRFSTSAGSTPGLTVARDGEDADPLERLQAGRDRRPRSSRRGPGSCRAASWRGRRAPSRRRRARQLPVEQARAPPSSAGCCVAATWSFITIDLGAASVGTSACGRIVDRAARDARRNISRPAAAPRPRRCRRPAPAPHCSGRICRGTIA